jgi:hypothetical protein
MDEKIGYTCPCGTFHEAGVWGAAHWHIELIHTCQSCGRVNTIESGEVLESCDDGVR